MTCNYPVRAFHSLSLAWEDEIRWLRVMRENLNMFEKDNVMNEFIYYIILFEHCCFTKTDL